MREIKYLNSVEEVLTDTRFHTIGHVAETESTNDDLCVEAGRGAPNGLVLVADHQTSGRGRQHRRWFDNPGESLLVSTLIRTSDDPTQEPQTNMELLPLVAALALNECVGRSLGSVESQTGLKWPNDLLSLGEPESKLAGVLVESIRVEKSNDLNGGLERCFIVGVGMNLLQKSFLGSELRSVVATSLSKLGGVNIERDEVLVEFLRSFDHWLGLLDDGEVDKILETYRSCCMTLGREVVVREQAGTFNGKAVAISDHGQLVVELESGQRVNFNAGNVQHCTSVVRV